MNKVLSILAISTFLWLTACGGGSSAVSTNETKSAPPKEAAATPKETTSSKELEPIKIQVGHVTAKGSLSDMAVEYFAKKVSEKTDGKITVENLSGGQVGGDRDMVESVSVGSLTMSLASVGIFNNFTEAFSGLQIPYLLDDKIEKGVYESELIGVKAMAELEKMNVKGFGIVPLDYLEFGTTLNKPILGPDDLNDVVIRPNSENKYMIDSYSALGMDSVPMPYADMYSALQTGVINTGGLPLDLWTSSGMAELVKSISLAHSVSSTQAFITNTDLFNSYPEEYQVAIEESINEAIDYIYEIKPKVRAEHIQKLKDMGVEVVEMENRGAFVEKMKPVIEEFKKDNDWLKQTIELVDELRGQ